MKKLKKLGKGLLTRAVDYLHNRAKPIKGAIAYGVSYAATKVGFGLDPTTSAIVSAAIFAATVDRVYAIFGHKIATPATRE